MLVVERSRGQVKLYDADFAAAADLLQSDARNRDPAALTPELLFNDGATPAALPPAAKELVADSLFVDGAPRPRRRNAWAPCVRACHASARHRGAATWPLAAPPLGWAHVAAIC